MLVPSLIALTIASVSAFIGLNAQEEIFKVIMGCVCVISVLLTVVLAPWMLKLGLIAIPLVLDRFNLWSAEKSING